MVGKYMRITILVALTVFALICSIRAECVDPDAKIYVINNYTKKSVRQLLESNETEYYCDLTLSWPIDTTTIFNVTRHNQALATYQEVLNMTSLDNIDIDRKDGVNKDCLAIMYKIACAYAFPACVDGKEDPGLCTSYCDLMTYRCPTVKQT